MAVNKINKLKHPIAVYIPYLLTEGLITYESIISFKQYTYIKSQFVDDFSEFKAKASEVDIEWLQMKINQLSNTEEIAINSEILCGKRKIYLPLVDLSPKDINNKKFHEVISKLLDYWGMDFFVFDSGRSFHLYGTKPFKTKSSWLKFTASLLLLNEPGKQTLIDTRWVGHRMMAGFSSLRLSNNTAQYKRYPILMGMLSEISSSIA